MYLQVAFWYLADLGLALFVHVYFVGLFAHYFFFLFFLVRLSLELMGNLSFNQNVHPRFQAETIEQNKTLYFQVEKLAEKHGCTAAQLALAWILHQGVDVVPIPGK